MKNNIIWVLIRNYTPRAGRKSYPDLGAPVQRIHWLTNMERSWQYDDEKVCHLLHSTVSSSKHRAGAPSLISTTSDCGKDCGCGANTQKIWFAADDTRMLDAMVIYNVLFSELRPKLGGYAEIETDFWRREMIAILELGAYLSANKIVQQIWIVAYNTQQRQRICDRHIQQSIIQTRSPVCIFGTEKHRSGTFPRKDHGRRWWRMLDVISHS